MRVSLAKLEGRLEQLEMEVELLAPVAEIAQRRLEGTDVDWIIHKEKMIEKMLELIQKFKIDDQPSKAVAIIAQLLAPAAELTAPRRIVDDYEGKVRSLSSLRQERNRIVEATDEARRESERQSWRRSA